MDLVNLARTSKDLRRFLMSRKNILVWIVARQNSGATKVPDPPEDMSEPSWALLLFGPAVCSVRNQPSLRTVSIDADFMLQECSTRNIQRVDFALRRRLCTACRKKKYIQTFSSAPDASDRRFIPASFPRLSFGLNALT